jgi:hypothetical protein
MLHVHNDTTIHPVLHYTLQSRSMLLVRYFEAASHTASGVVPLVAGQLIERAFSVR